MIYFAINVSSVKRYNMVNNNHHAVIIKRLFAQNMQRYLYFTHIIISREYSGNKQIKYAQQNNITIWI